MKAIRKKPGEQPEIVEIENSLESLQKEVGGFVQGVTLADDLCVICDEEGRLKGYAHNCTVCGVDFVGTILVVGVDGEDFADLEDAEQAMELLLHDAPLMLTYNKETGMFEEYKRPFAVLEFATRADFEMHQDLIDRGAQFEWINAEIDLPADPDSMVLVIANGKSGGVELIEAIQLATYSDDGGWVLEMWPECENFDVGWWMPLPPLPWEAAERVADRLKGKEA